jgi:DUF4097 and DUF4098 domain-containing protein YvlB
MRFSLITLALLIPAMPLSADSVDETRKMAPDGLVLVDNLAGSVEISVWDRAEVEIQADLGDDVEELEISESTNGIRIRVRNESNSKHIDDTDIYLKVPVTAGLEVETVSADISVEGSEGDMILINTVSGDVDLIAAPERIEIHSVSGDVEFEGEVSRSSVETVSGEITLHGLSGEVAVSTVSGDVSLTTEEVTQGRFEAVSGDLQLDLWVADGGRLTSDSMSGDMILRLPENQQGNFTAQTFSGDIRTDFGKAASVSRGPGSLLEYSEGGNGASIRLESFSGDIHIRRQ